MLYYILVEHESHTYFKFYKPYGYLSQFINHQNKRRSKKLLSDLIHTTDRLMAVGRLDEKSEGLLLLTTDGKFSHHITSSKIEKEYHVMVDGIITKPKIEALQNGLDITVEGQSYRTKRCKAHILSDLSHIHSRFVRDQRHGPTSWMSITLKEGKFRQVRKMTAKIGLPTLRLVRVRVGNYHLNKMKPGDLEPLSY